MAKVYDIFGQVAPSATTETTLYTVPSSKSLIISNLCVCNRGDSSATFRISFSNDGAATAAKDYQVYDWTIPSNTSLRVDQVTSACLGTTDIIRVYASNANLSFTLSGCLEDQA